MERMDLNRAEGLSRPANRPGKDKKWAEIVETGKNNEFGNTKCPNR